MSTEKSSKLEPIIKADSTNITTWNHHLKDNVLRLGLTRVMSSDEAVRTAGALDLIDFSPDAESSAGYRYRSISSRIIARFPGNSESSRCYVGTLDGWRGGSANRSGSGSALSWTGRATTPMDGKSPCW